MKTDKELISVYYECGRCKKEIGENKLFKLEEIRKGVFCTRCIKCGKKFIINSYPNQKAIVVMDHDTFAEIWKILDTWDINTVVTDDGDPVTKEFMLQIKASGRIPIICRNSETEGLFKRFNILTDKFMGAVRPEADIPNLEGEEK